MNLTINAPALALLAGFLGGGLLNECRNQRTFGEQKAAVEDELGEDVPNILPDGWKLVGHPACVTWCRTKSGSEFDIEAMHPDGNFVKVRIACVESGSVCNWKVVNPPCEEH
jgi:hypothetical protein